MGRTKEFGEQFTAAPAATEALTKRSVDRGHVAAHGPRHDWNTRIFHDDLKACWTPEAIFIPDK
jgi:hypothetical protein